MYWLFLGFKRGQHRFCDQLVACLAEMDLRALTALLASQVKRLLQVRQPRLLFLTGISASLC